MLMGILLPKITRGSEQVEFSEYRNNKMVISVKVRLVLSLDEWIEL